MLIFLLTGAINIVDLADLKEVVDGKGIWSSKHTTMLSSHELALLSVSSIQFELKFLVEVVFNIFDILEFSKTQVIDLVCEIHFVALHVESLDCFWVVMTTDMEVTWNLIDKHKPRELASLLSLDRLDRIFNNSLNLCFSFMSFPILFSLLAGIHFSVSVVINVFDGSELVSVFIKSDLLKFALNINNVDASYINDIKTEWGAWAFWKSDIHVDVELLFARVDINHDLARFLEIKEGVSMSEQQGTNNSHEN